MSHAIGIQGETDALDDVVGIRALCLGLLDAEAQDVEDVGEGVEGGVGRLLVLKGVEVVHVVAAHDEQEDARYEWGASVTRLKFQTEAVAPKHIAKWNHTVIP